MSKTNTEIAAEWFQVDRAGLRDILARRGAEFAVYELVQNAWDTEAKVVNIQLSNAGDGLARLIVTDDDPEGFADLTHAFRLFAPSVKKGDATKRGRFNLGEKLVLALAETAVITSTKGTYVFDARGRSFSEAKQLAGSTFDGLLRLTVKEIGLIAEQMSHLIPPAGVKTTFNGQILKDRTPIKVVECRLQTELAGEDGRLRRAWRGTTISIHEVLPGETASIYEMGIPIVETGDRWHYDIAQKVPLSLDRDNVTPADLLTVRTYAFNAMAGLLTQDEANAGWARAAAADPRVEAPALTASIQARFGDKVVIYDPSDPEANKIAMSQGYQVLYGGNLSSGEWGNVRRYELIKPAGQVTPSPKAEFSGSVLDAEKYEPTEAMLRVRDYTIAITGILVPGLVPKVMFVNDPQAAFGAAWNEGEQLMIFNVGTLGKRWFEQDREAIDWLIIHELGHHFSSDHLGHEYLDALCRLGAKMRVIGERGITAHQQTATLVG